MVEKFHWTLEYVDSLSMGDFYEYLQVRDGKGKFDNSKLKGRFK